ncbi:MAG: asparaginase [Paludibacteraceae bacterium]
MKKESKVLVILTGGTITMVCDRESGALLPADMETFKAFVPELFTSDIHIDMEAFTPLLDSSDVNPENWARMAHAVYDHYGEYDGFVILHGTDTMSYSASALSFMLENLNKPVVFTGSQLPIGTLRSDAKENLLTAIEIAAAKDEEGNAIVPEVTLFFEDKLFRGNRTTKRNAEHFSAFNSYNYPALAKAGVHIIYQPHLIHYNNPTLPLRLRVKTDQNVGVLKLFPGIQEAFVKQVLTAPGLRGLVLETFGAGNAPSSEWLYRLLHDAVERGIIIVNKTQCNTGSVEMGLYAVSMNLLKAGVLSGYDITTEALLTKMMYLLGENPDEPETVKELLQKDLCGEVTIE